MTGLLIAVIGWAAVSLLWTPDLLSGIGAMVPLLLFLGAATVGTSGAGSGIILGLAVGVAVQAPLVAAQWIGLPTGIEQAVIPAGLFLNRNLMAEIAAPLLVYGVLRWQTGQTGHCVLSLALVAILALTVDRTAALGLLAVIIWRLPWVWRVQALAGGVMFVGLLTQLSPWGFSSIGSRIDIWSAAVAGLTPFGQGIGSFAIFYPFWEFAHCDPLQLMFELGLGALPLFMVVYRALDTRDPLLLAERGALLCLVVESLFSLPLYAPASTLLAGCLIGRLYGARLPLCRLSHVGGDPVGAHA